MRPLACKHQGTKNPQKKVIRKKKNPSVWDNKVLTCAAAETLRYSSSPQYVSIAMGPHTYLRVESNILTYWTRIAPHNTPNTSAKGGTVQHAKR